MEKVRKRCLIPQEPPTTALHSIACRIHIMKTNLQYSNKMNLCNLVPWTHTNFCVLWSWFSIYSSAKVFYAAGILYARRHTVLGSEWIICWCIWRLCCVCVCLCMFVCKYLRVLFERKYENCETYVPDLVPWNGRQLSPRFLPSKGPTNCAPCAPLHCGHSACLRVPHPMCDSVHSVRSHYTLKVFIHQLKVHKSSFTRGRWMRFVAQLRSSWV